MALEILKDAKLKQLLKDHSGRDQSAEEARDRVDQLITEFLIKIAQAAGKAAEAQRLTRIMPANIEDAFNEVLGQSEVAPDPARFLAALHKMDIADLGLVLRHIADWTIQDPKKQR